MDNNYVELKIVPVTHPFLLSRKYGVPGIIILKQKSLNIRQYLQFVESYIVNGR